MRNITRKSHFKKDFKKLSSSNRDITKLVAVIRALANNEPLPPHNRDHALTGNYVGYRECHISPDWLLIYKIENDTLILVRTGTHSELF